MLQRVVLCALAGLVSTARAEFPDRSTLGRTDKYRVLVDKVISPTNKWVFTGAHMQEIRDAGFNVVSPRIGGHDVPRARKQAELAAEHELYYMAWMRGTLSAKGPLRMVWQDGKEQPLCSPNSDEFWDWTTEIVLGHARTSVEVPSFLGVFLDYENYAPESQGNCYALSYDSRILAEFAQARGKDVPDLAADQRYPWLKKEGLIEAFREFQIQSWRRRCRKLRQQVDAINPLFQFIIYPAPGTLFMTEAIFPEWGTQQAPLVLADATTYGRPSEFMAEDKALAANRNALLANMAYVRSRGVPHHYAGGIDPVVKGADPEFSGKNASMLAHISDGYWIFYEGPRYTKDDHGVYFEWFGRANAEIAEGTFALQHVPRSAPENLGQTVVKRTTQKPQVGLYSMKTRMFEALEAEGTFEVHKVEGMSLEYLKQLDVVVLQNFNLSLPADSDISRNLRAYVEQGGGLLLGHDTAWFMESMFPEIAVRGYPKNNVEAERHVVETDLVVAQTHPSLGDAATGARFDTEFRDHMIFKPGAQGTTVIRNGFGDPVYVLGQVGKGRVMFSGSYYGYSNPLAGLEAKVFVSVLHWLGKLPR